MNFFCDNCRNSLIIKFLNKHDEDDESKNENENENNRKSVFLLCESCGFRKELTETTLIYKNESQDVSGLFRPKEYKNMKNSNILSCRYIMCNACDNKLNPTLHKLIHKNNSYDIEYICSECGNII